MPFWSPIVSRPSDGISAELRALLSATGDSIEPRPPIDGTLWDRIWRETRHPALAPADRPGLPWELWEEGLALLPTNLATDTDAIRTGTFLKWLGRPETVLHGDAATPERFMSGAALLADHLGQGWPGLVPPALDQWILAAGHGVRRDQMSPVLPQRRVRWIDLPAGQRDALLGHLLRQCALHPREGAQVVETLLGNLPRDTPGLETLWHEWLRTTAVRASQPDDPEPERLWRQAMGRAVFLPRAFTMRPDWTDAEITQWMATSEEEEIEHLVPQDRPPVPRILARLRHALDLGVIFPDWPLWDHLETRHGELWPESIPVVIEVLTHLGPTLRQWGATAPDALRTWLSSPALCDALPRPLQRELLLHAHPDVRRLMAVHLATPSAAPSRPDATVPAPRR